ncbi:hypothetical protein DPMN_119777 [Dreissena polymorpha]|uniref:Uncharacterized protein n=1 Tax=Dreissena polymorpha TaxID=45954 RepID=A0A9D4JPP0_DREPO|nr:hypothetical protein DPMN_119777 [Dreissena polymorpha]
MRIHAVTVFVERDLPPALTLKSIREFTRKSGNTVYAFVERTVLCGFTMEIGQQLQRVWKELVTRSQLKIHLMFHIGERLHR